MLFYVRWRTASLKRQHRKLARLVAVRTEELKKKKEEADVQRSRAELSEKAKEQFLANMSHEIRTPMNAIMGMTGILQREAHPPEQDRYLDAIAQSSENLLVILNDILDMSKIDAGKIDFEDSALRTAKGDRQRAGDPAFQGGGEEAGDDGGSRGRSACDAGRRSHAPEPDRAEPGGQCDQVHRERLRDDADGI